MLFELLDTLEIKSKAVGKLTAIIFTVSRARHFLPGVGLALPLVHRTARGYAYQEDHQTAPAEVFS